MNLEYKQSSKQKNLKKLLRTPSLVIQADPVTRQI